MWSSDVSDEVWFINVIQVTSLSCIIMEKQHFVDHNNYLQFCIYCKGLHWFYIITSIMCRCFLFFLLCKYRAHVHAVLSACSFNLNTAVLVLALISQTLIKGRHSFSSSPFISLQITHMFTFLLVIYRNLTLCSLSSSVMHISIFQPW